MIDAIYFIKYIAILFIIINAIILFYSTDHEIIEFFESIFFLNIIFDFIGEPITCFYYIFKSCFYSLPTLFFAFNSACFTDFDKENIISIIRNFISFIVFLAVGIINSYCLYKNYSLEYIIELIKN